MPIGNAKWPRERGIGDPLAALTEKRTDQAPTSRLWYSPT